MKKDKWIWMPHAGHLIVGSYCQFRLNTYVGKYIVSTVGEYPKSEISAKYFPIIESDYMSNFDEIGFDGKYETMVFRAKKSKEICCPYEIIVSKDVACERYNTAEEAYKGHLRLCKKWGKKL